ncbi:hypothetical protein GX865_02800 [Candidatus Saccharibacteria bacterium]|jgi:hypothetical protein|nr:hypothetical protein [Candidatus Saccharibacteria bacterium]
MKINFWERIVVSRWLFPTVIASAILTSLILVSVSLVLYNQSGAAQLDLSRPSFQAVRSKAQQSEPFNGFEASSGPLNEKDLGRFERLYIKKNSEMHSYSEDFSPNPLSDKSLGIVVRQND